MKKTNTFYLLLAVGAFLLTSCSASINMVTNNPVGTKMGIAKIGLFAGRNQDMSLEAAAKNGKITKIGTVEIRQGFLSVKTIVTGE